MTDFAWYLLKVLLCSAILVGYYWLSLRNKKFHGYNRFYLLASVVLSWLIPLIKIDFWKGDLEQPQVIKLLEAVTSGNRYVEEAAFRNQFTWDWNIAALIAFVFISSVYFLRLTLSIVRIWLLISRNPAKKWNDIYFIFSNAKGTPFSFFKYIFWNEDINLNSFEGEQILKHELQHVHQKHSADKIFLNLALIVGWYNPFLWLIRNELNLIHEFIADKQAISDGDTSAFAAMLLKATYPQHTFSLTNQFFYSPVKRRLLMLTSSKKTSYSYIRRLAILPLLSVVVLFFAFKLKDKNAVTRVVNLEKNYTVIIDVGPAGNNAGAIGIKGVNEKETALQLSKLVKALNKNENIEIFLSGANNDHLTPGQRFELLVSKNADLLISLHVNTIPIKENEKPGVLQREAPDVFVMYTNKMSDNDDKILGSILSQNLQPVFRVAASVNKPQSGVYILNDANKICPSVLIECGFIAGEKDKQAEVSKGILKSIEEYFFYAEKKAINDDFQQQYLSVSNVDTVKAVPQFPGGALSWKKYLERNVDAALGAKAGAPKGLYKVTIRFTVDKEGSISNINAITSNGYGFEDASINLIKKGPKWVPAKKDNLFIDAVAEQDFYFSVPVQFVSS